MPKMINTSPLMSIGTRLLPEYGFAAAKAAFSSLSFLSVIALLLPCGPRAVDPLPAAAWLVSEPPVFQIGIYNTI